MDNLSDQSSDNSPVDPLEEKMMELIRMTAKAIKDKDLVTAKFLFKVGRLLALKMEAAERQPNAQFENQCSEIIDHPNSSINSNPDG